MSLTLLLPIFLLAAIGAVLGRLGWLRAGWQAGVAELTAKGLIPALLFTSTYLLAGAALPCALLSLGASLAVLRLDRLAHAAAVAAAKLVVLPLSVFALATFLHLPAQVRTVLVVLASCPVGVNAAFVIRADGKDTQLVDSAILLSSLACAATMPLWLWSLKMA